MVDEVAKTESKRCHHTTNVENSTTSAQSGDSMLGSASGDAQIGCSNCRTNSGAQLLTCEVQSGCRTSTSVFIVF